MGLLIGVPTETAAGEKRVATVPDVVEKLMGLVWSKDLKTLRYTTGNSLFVSLSRLCLSLSSILPVTPPQTT
jgi:hypothetical protein